MYFESNIIHFTYTCIYNSYWTFQGMPKTCALWGRDHLSGAIQQHGIGGSICDGNKLGYFTSSVIQSPLSEDDEGVYNHRNETQGI